MEIKDYFDIRELVCRHVYSKFGEKAWDFIDKDLLAVLLAIRKGIGKPITVNTWHMGGNLSQRGLRCNTCDLVLKNSKMNKLYLSAHIQGKAVDFDIRGMTANEVRRWISDNKDLIPCQIRLENGTSWVHLDVRPTSGINLKVQYFNG